MHRVEYPATKSAPRDVTVHCTNSRGESQQKRIPLVNLATFILNSVQERAANRGAPQVQRIEWSPSNV